MWATVPSAVICMLGDTLRKILNAKKPTAEIHGFVKPGFEPVKDAFTQNFESYLEPEGATFAVYHKGELVVDLWAGYANSRIEKEWTHETLCIGFSTTKAGVAILDQDVTFDIVRHHEKMSTVLEDQTPNWTIDDKKAGYHAITFGFLVDQLIRRVDPQKRSLGKFFQEEIAQPYDIEFHIGLPEEYHSRVCHLVGPNALQFVYDLSEPDFIRAIYKMCKNPTSALLWQSLKNPKWLEVGKNGETAFNDPELYKLEIGGANGICTARSLAKLLTLLIGEKSIFSPNLMQILDKPLLTDSPDVVLGVHMNYGHGFMYFKNPNGHYKIGHTGYGGQNARVDPDYQLSFAYLHNALSSDSGAYSRTFKILENAVYKSVMDLKD